MDGACPDNNQKTGYYYSVFLQLLGQHFTPVKKKKKKANYSLIHKGTLYVYCVYAHLSSM